MTSETPTKTLSVGFIGLGRMGSRMAARILAASYPLCVHDVRPDAGRSLIAQGAIWCDDAAAIGRTADIVISCLPGPAQAEAVMAGPQGLLSAAKRHAVIVETGTIGPELGRTLASAARERDVFFLDAPVSGGEDGAETGSLACMVGGEQEAFARARPVLECFSNRIDYLGPSGAGAAVKLVIQAIFLTQMTAFFEGLALGERAGVPVATLLDIIAASSAHHPTIAKRYPKILANDLSPRFEVSSAEKDLTLAAAFAAAQGVPTATLDAALEVYARAARMGFAGKDLAAIRSLLSGG
jgi:3-hydroxyisobutyrate dehydrogenase-like beta-hydroxyacid dehydrogenase